MAEKAILLDGSVAYSELTPDQYERGKAFLAESMTSYEFDDTEPDFIRLVGTGPGSISDQEIVDFEAAIA